jgi:hypothetical protein
LRISGYKDHLFGTGYYYLDATLVSIQPSIIQKITFMVDTGCQITTISFKDSLNFSSIPPPATSTVTASGNVPTSVLFNCGLAFGLGQSIQLEKLLMVNILNPEITPQNRNAILRTPSTLGMDILSRYYLSFDSISVTLEK